MGTVRYTNIDGEIIAEKRDGVRKQYIPDPLGNTVALLDNTSFVTDTFKYWPYGELVDRTGITPTPFQFIGTWGYYQDNSTQNYVRARYQNSQTGRWNTKDPIGFDSGDVNLYRYVSNRVMIAVDSRGLQLGQPSTEMIHDDACNQCSKAILENWVFQGFNYIPPRPGPPTWQHACNHFYAHCMACCALSEHVDELCANQKQNAEIALRPGTPEMNNGRWHGCNAGKAAAKRGKDCNAACADAFKWKDALGPPNGDNDDGTGSKKKCKDHMNDPNKAFPTLAACCPKK